MITTFSNYINEYKGSRKSIEAGNIELKNVDYYFALEYLTRNGFDVLSIIPNFEKNFNLCKKIFSGGTTLRKNMPRLGREDVLELQTKLKNGAIDIRKPFHKNTNVKNPFPEGLKGEEGEEFLKRGYEDGNMTDDITKVIPGPVVLKKLKPIQQQVYFDQCVDFFLNYRSILTIQKQLTDRYFLISKDNYLLDGHHRLAIGIMMDPNFTSPAIQVSLPFNKLLPLALSFGDAIGNERNK